jgi:hypothetical protein
MTEIQKRFITGLEKKGRITAHAVLDAARPESSPIHDCFDWDDSEAAEKWRLEQARVTINLYAYLYHCRPPCAAHVSVHAMSDPTTVCTRISGKPSIVTMSPDCGGL